MEGWTLVHSAGTRQEAEIVRGLLEVNDIPAVVIDQGSSPYPLMGPVDVYVGRDDVVRALYLVRKHREA